MGKVIVIKGADFSGVAVERIEFTDSGRTEIDIPNDGYFYNNRTVPERTAFTDYGSVKIDVSAYVGMALVVSGAAGSGETSFLVRIDNAEDMRLYLAAGTDETIRRVETTIPEGAKYLYINNYFGWDADPFAYIYDTGI